jgi:hypothetical protein
VLRQIGPAIAARLRAAGCRVDDPEGGFYLFPDLSALRERLAARGIHDARLLCERLLEDTGVAVLPGSDFGRSPAELSLRLAGGPTSTSTAPPHAAPSKGPARPGRQPRAPAQRHPSPAPPSARLTDEAELMDHLGLPSSKRAVKAMGKIRPASMSRGLVGGLKRLLADDAALAIIGHLPALNLGVLELLLDPQLRTLATPVLFEAVVAEPQETYFPFTARRLADIRRMADGLGVDVSRRRFRERDRIDALFEDLTRDYLRLEDGALQSCRFPLPPIPGTDDILPLRAPRALVEEGRRQHNCVAGYAPRVAEGDTFIYRVLRPQRATLSLVRWPGGGWQIGELFLAGNHPVGAATRRAVADWLASHKL